MLMHNYQKLQLLFISYFLLLVVTKIWINIGIWKRCHLLFKKYRVKEKFYGYGKKVEIRTFHSFRTIGETFCIS